MIGLVIGVVQDTIFKTQNSIILFCIFKILLKVSYLAPSRYFLKLTRQKSKYC